MFILCQLTVTYHLLSPLSVNLLLISTFHRPPHHVFEVSAIPHLTELILITASLLHY